MLVLRFIPFPVIETDRLLFRQLEPADEKEVLALRSNENVNRFLTREHYRTLRESRAFINKINRGITNGEWIYWGLSLKNDAKLIGTICLWNFQLQHYRAEIGYELNPEFWGRGIMKEAIQRVIQYGFEELQLHSIEADIHPGNLRSIKLLEQNGFIREGYFRESTFFDGKFSDRAVYSLLNAPK